MSTSSSAALSTAAMAGLVTLSVLCFTHPASALSMQECSEKYKAASKGGSSDMSWNEFRKEECGPGATMALKKAKAAKKEQAKASTAPSMEECSARYKSAKKDGTLGGMSWNEFRSAGCIAKTAEAPKTPPAKAAQKKSVEPTKISEKECSARYQAAKSAGTLGDMTWNAFRSAGCPATIAKRSGSMSPTMGSIFPTAVSRKYSGESAGRARLLTCRDQYEANKAAGITEPKWTEEGGGYYSECNRHLSQQ
ncbi:Antifreeze protein [Hyphomicrobium sp. 1Nfss2.1]|uniref:antifreeze protein n=1 Tax=Hyphomicrobium sp. 1Nfss2.1 TaxID=3413936 RepID=UPI003C7AAFBA